jgi:hypothetical protein
VIDNLLARFGERHVTFIRQVATYSSRALASAERSFLRLIAEHEAKIAVAEETRIGLSAVSHWSQELVTFNEQLEIVRAFIAQAG